MALIGDFHTHTEFSFDGHSSAKEMAEAAKALGYETLAVTDHCDLDSVLDGIYPPYDAAAIKEALAQAEEETGTTLLFGIEIGQPYLCRREAEEILSGSDFDYVLGSVHNLEKVPDFIFFDYKKMPEELFVNLYNRYLDDNIKLARCGMIDTIAHIGYPLRYLTRAGKELSDDGMFDDKLAELFRAVIENGICLEINYSGLRNAEASTFPNRHTLEVYRACGGKAITFGSDAHFAKHIGSREDEAVAMALELGFDEYTVFGKGRTRRTLPLLR